MVISMTARSVSLPVMASEDAPDLHVIDIFMMSVKCGNCDNYQTIVKFRKGPEKNVYTYECENEICDPNVTRTIVEVPRHLDNSTRRAEELPYYEREKDVPDEPAD
jgi:ribosomal protein S27E